MLNNILVLLDGSSLAERAVPHAHALAQTFQASVTFLHVLEAEDKTGRIDPVSWHLRKVEAQAYLSNISQQWDLVDGPPELILLEGVAASRIVEYVSATNPDLILMSSHGESGLTPWNISSVAQKIIYRAGRSFMLLRSYQEQLETAVPYRRLLVPLDGSKRAEYVLPFAYRLAEAHRAELLLVHVAAQPELLQRQPLSLAETELLAQLAERNRTEAEGYLAQVAAQAPAQTTTHLLKGPNVPDTLLEFAARENIDLVMMNAHGYSNETARPYGNIVSSFIAYSNTSLFIIQDLPPDRIRASQAELIAAELSDTGRLRPIKAHAQLTT
jgi:nucleotide-binding universal stress UspA family protein